MNRPRKPKAEPVCFYCTAPLGDPADQANPLARTNDHIVPRVAIRNIGWLFPPEWHALNLVRCCQTCNAAKGPMRPQDWCRMLTDPAAKARLYNRLVALGLPAEALQEAMQ